MFARLERYLYTLMAVLALCVVIPFVTPVAAHAQQTPPTKDAQDTINVGAEYVVVSSGDSLWTIISERIGPNATLQQVANGVERIYALNQSRISDPDLIFPDQKLLLPSTAQLAKTKPARKAAKPAESSPTGRPTETETNRASRTLQGQRVREDNGKNNRVPEPEAKSATLLTLPDEVASAAVPSVRPLISNESPSSLAETRADRYRMLGLMILLPTGVVPILVALTFRWAVGRKARMRKLRFKKKFGSNYTAYDPLVNHEDTSKSASKACGLTTPSGGSRNGGTMTENHSSNVGALAIARAKRERIRREQELGPERPSRQYPGPDIQGPKVSSSLRRQSPSWSQKRLLHRRGRSATVTVVATPTASQSLQEEWEPSPALRNALEKIPLQPGVGSREARSRLEPHLEEAVKTLTRIERRRGLSDRERLREQALRMLLEALKEVE